MSEAIYTTQQLAIMPDLLRISYFYPHQPARVKSKLHDFGPPWCAIQAVNLTFQKADMVPLAVTNTAFLGG